MEKNQTPPPCTGNCKYRTLSWDLFYGAAAAFVALAELPPDDPAVVALNRAFVTLQVPGQRSPSSIAATSRHAPCRMGTVYLALPLSSN